MNLIARTIAAAIFAFLGSVAYAAWTVESLVGKVNPGGNGVHGTFITLIGSSFSGCPSTTTAFVDAADPNYKEFVASISCREIDR